jgi:hypothetical protein
MTIIVLRILTVLNALIGLGLVAAAVWPSEPTGEKKPVLVVIYLIWALSFLGLSSVTFNLKPVARKWTIGLYGFASFATIWGFLSDVITRDKIFVVFPWVSVSTYLLFLAFFMWPVIFMLRPSMKEYFANIQEARRKAEEEAARASLRR